MPQNHSDSRLGRLLRNARRGASLTQGALAGAAGCSTRSVWQAENGRGGADAYLRLLAVLGFEVTGRSLPPGEHLGDRLRILRLRLCASVRQVAAKADISPNTIGAIERGTLGHLAALERIADILGAGLMLVPAGQSAAFSTGAALSSAHHIWSTPPELMDRLYAAIGGGFSLDPCSPGALRSRVRAERHLTVADDGLAHEWRGRVYMNPPYNRKIGAWTSKARLEVTTLRAEFVVGLVPARTDTRWWHTDVAGHAAIWLLRGRLYFGDAAAGAPFPSALTVWGGTPEIAASLSTAFPDAQHIPLNAVRAGYSLATNEPSCSHRILPVDDQR